MFHCAADEVADITVNIGDVRQTIDGFGVSNSPTGLTTQLADLFFSTSSGIGLSLFRQPISSGGSGPYGSDDVTLYADCALASARGALVWTTPWTANNPTWKDNGSLINGHLLSAHYSDWAAVLAGFQADLLANAGCTCYAVSAGNEPDFVPPYESMEFTAAEMTAWIKVLGPALAALSPRPLLVSAECENWDHASTYLANTLADGTATGFLDLVGTHQYEGTVAPLATTKKVWQTEMSGISDVFDASMTDGLVRAAQIHSALTTGNVSAWHWWWAIGQGMDNEGLIGKSGDTTITKRLYVLGNWSKFVRPGYVRCATVGAVSNISVTAFKDPMTNRTIMVAINIGSDAQIKARLNGLSYTNMSRFRTSATENLDGIDTVGVTQGILTMNLPASSVTTFMGIGT